MPARRELTTSLRPRIRLLEYVLFLLAGAGLALGAAPARAECDDDVLCIHARDAGDTVELHAENRSPFPITYTLRVRGNDVQTDGARTITRTLSAASSEPAMTLRNRRDDSPMPRYRYTYDWTIGDKDAVHNDDYVYRLPYASGKSYRVIQSFGSRFSHTGLEQFAIDFLMREGTPVHAAREGVVARLEESNSIGCWEDGCGRYANYVVILHDDGTTGEYYHLLKDGVLVNLGDRVSAGQKIALSGNTGHTTVAHLHFAVYRAVDWGNTQSIPVRFVSADGIIDRPRRGGRYQATAVPSRRSTAQPTAAETAGGE